MKVGNLTFKRLCCKVDLVYGPNPIVASFIQIVFAVVIAGSLSYLALAVKVDYQKWIAITLIIVTTLTYLKLCYSDPGVAPEILRKLNHNDSSIVPVSASIEEPLLHNFIVCSRCVVCFGLSDDEIETKNKVMHCMMCGICVVGVDHHCMFFDRCIASNNLVLFYANLVLLFATFSLTLGLFYYQENP